jgi:hypothetical protein
MIWSLVLGVVFGLAMPLVADAQVVVVQRNVNVRPTPSSEHTPLAKLLPGDEADLLDVPPENSIRSDSLFDLRPLRKLCTGAPAERL